MKTFGIVGGVASGKSLVSQQLAELGAGILDADRAGHEVLAKDPDVRTALLERWGTTILAADGSVDRGAIAARVFADSAGAERKFLESLLHPRIQRRLDDQRKKFAAEGRPVVVLDAPLLLEAGWGPMCDTTIMVDAPRDVRLARAKERGWSEAEFDRREAAQWPVTEKLRLADAVIQNFGTIADLNVAVRRIWSQHVKPT